MHCRHCGHELFPDDARFCRQCGSPLPRARGVLSPRRAERADAPGAGRGEASYAKGMPWLLLSLLFVIVMSLLGDFTGVPQHYVRLVAAALMLVGLARTFYPHLSAGRVESFDGELARAESGGPALPRPGARRLPGPRGVPVEEFTRRGAGTAEMLPVPSVTEHTTRLLDERAPRGGREFE